MASVVEEGIGDPQLKTEIGAVVGNAGAAGAGGELEVPIAVPQRILRQPVGVQCQSQHHVASLLSDFRLLNQHTAAAQFPGGEVLRVQGAVTVQRFDGYAVRQFTAVQKGVVEGHKEHVSVFWEGHLRIGNFAVGGGKVTAVRQRGEGHGDAAGVNLGGADGLPASLHPHVELSPAPAQ